MFIIGLLKQLRPRVEGEARRVGRYVTGVYADFVGPQGLPRLLPIDSDAIHSLRHYLDNLASYEDAQVLVLPYTPIPQDLEDELRTVKDLGGMVAWPQANSQDLPKLVKRPDTAFWNAVFMYIAKQLRPEAEELELPSEYFVRVSGENPRLLIAVGALQSCDMVPQHRWDFLRKAADAFALLVQRQGDSGGRLDAFFQEHGLDHAQSGGVSAKLEVYKDGQCVYEETSNTHIKQGDHTTAVAAARIYYQLFSYAGGGYIAILYAGPHPKRDICGRCYL